MKKTLDEIINHLEFLGYTIEKMEPKEEGEKYGAVAKHSGPDHNNIVIIELEPGFFYFRVNLTTEREPSPEMDKFVNNLSSKLDIARFYYDQEENGLVSIRFEAMFIGEYDKSRFSKFMEFFEKDLKKLYLIENFEKIFLKQEK